MRERQEDVEASGPVEVRLALLQQRLGILISTIEKKEDKDDQWRGKMDVAVQHFDTRFDAQDTKIESLGARVGALERKVEEKVGTVAFTTIWRIIAGAAVTVTMAGGLLAIARTLGLLH